MFTDKEIMKSNETELTCVLPGGKAQLLCRVSVFCGVPFSLSCQFRSLGSSGWLEMTSLKGRYYYPSVQSVLSVWSLCRRLTVPPFQFPITSSLTLLISLASSSKPTRSPPSGQHLHRAGGVSLLLPLALSPKMSFQNNPFVFIFFSSFF